MAAIAARARALIRANLRSTVALALLVGLAGGFVLASWSAARRGSASFDGFLHASGQPDLIVGFCAPNATAAEINSSQGCKPYDPRPELKIVRRLPGVEAAARGSLIFGTYHLRGENLSGPMAVLIDRGGFPTVGGRPVVLDGRLADPRRANEVVVPEALSGLVSVAVGDVVGFTPHRADRSKPPATSRLTVVGIVRGPSDLAAGLDPSAATFSNSVPFAGPAWWQRYGQDAQSLGVGVFVRVADGRGDAVRTELRKQFPGRHLDFDTARDRHTEASIRDAIRYETTALGVIALVGAIAWFVFAGQALVRQAARERSDSRTLVALGMTRTQLVAGGVLRALPLAAAAAVIAVAVAVASSEASPFGQAARAEVDHGVAIDPFVVSLGVGIIVVAVVAVFAAVSRGPAARRRNSARRFRRRSDLPFSISAGGTLLWSTRPRTMPILTSLTMALAIVCGVAGLGLAQAARHLSAEPRAYGTTWDGSVSERGDPFLDRNRIPDAIAAARATPDVHAIGAVIFDDAGRVGHVHVPIVATWTIFGAHQPWPAIVAGRVPKDLNEVALGPEDVARARPRSRRPGLRPGDA